MKFPLSQEGQDIRPPFPDIGGSGSDPPSEQLAPQAKGRAAKFLSTGKAGKESLKCLPRRGGKRHIRACARLPPPFLCLKTPPDLFLTRIRAGGGRLTGRSGHLVLPALPLEPIDELRHEPAMLALPALAFPEAV